MDLNALSRNYVSYAEAAKWGHTPEIQKKADATVKEAMTDRYVKRVQTLAREDAQKGVYMDHAYVQTLHAQIKAHVSPDRSGPIAQVNALAQNTMLDSVQEAIEEGIQELDRLFGLFEKHKAKAPAGGVMESAELYSADGEMIASYNRYGSGWTIDQTKAETKFFGASSMVYAQAFREARAEMQAQADGSGASVDFKA